MVNLEIQKERETPLLCRRRIVLAAEYQGATPSRLQFKKEVAKKLGADENLVILKHIYTRFGKQKCKIIAHIYSNEKDMKTYEDEYLLKKHSEKKEEGKEGKKEGAAGAEKEG